MASNLLLRPSIHSSPQISKPSLRFSPLTKPSNLTFRTQKTQSLKALSITNQTLKPQFLSNPNPNPNPSYKTPNKTICKAAYETVPATDRLISILSYFIPFLGGLSYGFHLFSSFPTFERLFNPLVPLVGFYKSIYGVNMLSFFGLYLGIVRDRKFSRYVRFNALQALFLEFLLVAPSLLQLLFNSGEGFGVKILEVTYSAVFLVILAYFLYSLGFCLFGRTPHFPYVSDAMETRLSMEDRFG